MLRIDVKLPLNFSENDIKSKICEIFPVSEGDIRSLMLVKLSLELSSGAPYRKAAIGVSFDPELEEKFAKRTKVCSKMPELEFTLGRYDFGNSRPVVVGAGPCGLFAALILAEGGARPIILERGLPIEKRDRKVELMRTLGVLDPECNVQFGEGGAGTYSDGKLKVGSLDKYKYKILREFIAAGAEPDIVYSATAHLGTDRLGGIVRNLRKKIIAHGGEFIWGAKFVSFSEGDGKIHEISYEMGGETFTLPCTELILATGHSARDTVRALHSCGVEMIPHGFGIGMRIEHPREYINELVYGKNYDKRLETASYHLVTHLGNGRSVYSFCMCPGGTVVPATSDPHGTVTNGMSVHGRDGENSNSALLVSLTPDDFQGSDALAGIELQERIEHAAYLAAGGGFVAPRISMGELLRGRAPRAEIGEVKPSYPCGTAPVDPRQYLPDYVVGSLAEAFGEFDAWMPGFFREDAVLTGAETRTTSPIRIVRDAKTRMTPSCDGLYPAGEGAGYAGGIISSALDGVHTAMAILEKHEK